MKQLLTALIGLSLISTMAFANDGKDHKKKDKHHKKGAAVAAPIKSEGANLEQNNEAPAPDKK